VGYFQNKSVIVTGATGLIGRQLVKLLAKEGANITAVSLDKFNKDDELDFKHVQFVFGDLRDFDFCKSITESCEIVFHLAGIKGSPMLTQKQPSTFFVNTLMFNLNLIEAARRNRVKNFLYTSSVGVYSPSDVLYEDSVWKSMPSSNDRFAGWAKRMGELQLEAAQIEFGWNGTHIVRPSNVYGPWDNFDLKTSMVIPSLIAKTANGENPLKVWGDGSAVRDFIHAYDVAKAMLFVVEKNINEPVNIGSGVGVSIKHIAAELQKIKSDLQIEWDISKPKGDDVRILDMTKLKKYGFAASISIEDGLKDTYQWYETHKNSSFKRYDAFNE
jgi:GDP-L-fucose synthase